MKLGTEENRQDAEPQALEAGVGAAGSAGSPPLGRWRKVDGRLWRGVPKVPPEHDSAAFCGADHRRLGVLGQGSTALRGAGPRNARVGSLAWVWWRRPPP